MTGKYIFRSHSSLFRVFGAVMAGVAVENTAALAAEGDSVLRDQWIDPDTGHQVVRLSRLPGKSESFYFHQNGFTKDGGKLVFANSVAGEAMRLVVLDWATRKIEPLTETGVSGGVVSAKTGRVYYQRQGTLYWTDVQTRSNHAIAQLPRGWSAGTVNADDTLMAGTFVASGPAIDRSGPKGQWFDKTFEAQRPQCLFTVEVATGQTNIFYRYEGWLGHIQFSPTDPELLMFCHEGPWHKLDRIWHIRTDGSGLRLIHARTMTNEIAGHEFWSADGKRVWFDLQMPRSVKFFLAGKDINDQREGALSKLAEEIRYPLARDEWSVHFNISRDGKLFAGDGGAPNMVARARNGKWIYLFTPQPDGKVGVERLVNMTKHDYTLEPNVNFAPDGKWIVFRGNFEGTPQVYAVEVAKAKP